MRIAHLADLHLGRRTPGDANGSERLAALRDAVEDLAKEGAEAMLVAGDVFDSPHIDRATIAEAVRILERPVGDSGDGIPVLVIPGNHDPVDSASLWRTFQGCQADESNVQLVLKPSLVTLIANRLEVEAYPCATRYSADPPWLPPVERAERTEEPNRPIRILLAHGSLLGGPVPEGESDAYPFTVADLEKRSFDYAALGHYHRPYPTWDKSELQTRRFSYCGTHEPDHFSIDEGYALLVDIEHDGMPTVRRLPVGRRSWRVMVLRQPSCLKELGEFVRKVQDHPDPRRFLLRIKVSPELRLGSEEADRLEQYQGQLRVLGVHVEQQGDIPVTVRAESLDLDVLPDGAVKQTLLELQRELLELNESSESERALLGAALQIGWETVTQLRPEHAHS